MDVIRSFQKGPKMANTTAQPSNKQVEYLSNVLLAGKVSQPLFVPEFDECLDLANKHHVVVRWLQALLEAGLSKDSFVIQRAKIALEAERARIANALPFLDAICSELNRHGCNVTVIKSLDHWPDLGSDLDLYSNAPSGQIIHVMKERFRAQLAPRSWGDRLACKWNFIVPGLPEAIEIHVGRLGQMGEHIDWASSVPGRAIVVQRAQFAFRVACPEDRIMISTLQRMYRHFYFRLCDIVDTAELLQAGGLDFVRLRLSSDSAGIWKGVASYLAIVADYVRRYRGDGPGLPTSVLEASSLTGNHLTFNSGFLRVPIVPHSIALYTREVTAFALSGNLSRTCRLGLLPCLAAAAALGQKLTGSDKGIW